MKNNQSTMIVSNRDKTSIWRAQSDQENLWTVEIGSQHGTTRTSVKVRWPRPMETTQEVKLAPRKPRSGKGGSLWCTISALLGKTPQNGKALKCLVAWKPRKPWGKAQKAKGGTHARKIGGIYRGHPWAVSRFGWNLVIPFSTQCVAGRGERKLSLITR